RWDIDLTSNSAENRANKRFDFVVKTKQMIYLIETNFYGGKSGGSKLNETARSYKMLSQDISSIDGLTFVWITDGTGWNSAKGNLRETFDVLDSIFSIEDMESGKLADFLNKGI
ncbi:MAG: restriction endonuclease, partial [Ruminococcaceae bacterium]|nr:restriction endonuclease [Oscillospiraceae bacterium]